VVIEVSDTGRRATKCHSNKLGGNVHVSGLSSSPTTQSSYGNVKTSRFRTGIQGHPGLVNDILLYNRSQ
jgi:hypothetical protein